MMSNGLILFIMYPPNIGGGAIEILRNVPATMSIAVQNSYFCSEKLS